jgi:hypothetical protein
MVVHYLNQIWSASKIYFPYLDSLDSSLLLVTGKIAKLLLFFPEFFFIYAFIHSYSVVMWSINALVDFWTQMWARNCFCFVLRILIKIGFFLVAISITMRSFPISHLKFESLCIFLADNCELSYGFDGQKHFFFGLTIWKDTKSFSQNGKLSCRFILPLKKLQVFFSSFLKNDKKILTYFLNHLKSQGIFVPKKT